MIIDDHRSVTHSSKEIKERESKEWDKEQPGLNSSIFLQVRSKVMGTVPRNYHVSEKPGSGLFRGLHANKVNVKPQKDSKNELICVTYDHQ